MAEVAGVVMESCRARLYRVRLEQGSIVMAHIADRMDRNFIRLLVGDRVRIELSPVDSGAGGSWRSCDERWHDMERKAASPRRRQIFSASFAGSAFNVDRIQL